jgi:hypothetical protein
MPETSSIKNNKNNGFLNRWKKRKEDKNRKKLKRWHMHNKH